jgi:hypothetical protein
LLRRQQLTESLESVGDEEVRALDEDPGVGTYV